jgi:HK97 family phage major capsid protein
MLKRNFSFRKFIEGEPIEDLGEPQISPHGGRAMPLDLLFRDLGTDTFSGGGALVGQSTLKDVTPFLRARTVCGKLGADIRTGLTMPTNFPVLTADFSAQWLAERATVTTQDLAVAWASMTPHRISISLNASTLLSTQSVADFDLLIQQQATQKLFQALDQAALNGTGGVQPIGVLNTPNVPPFTFGGSATWSKVLSAPQAVKNANAPDGSFGWAVSPDVEARWKNIQKFSGSSTTIMDDRGNVAGYSSEFSTELNSTNASNRVIFGSWNDLKIGIFGDSAWVTINPFTNSANGEKVFTLHLYCDAGITRPACFIASTDSGAQ